MYLEKKKKKKIWLKSLSCRLLGTSFYFMIIVGLAVYMCIYAATTIICSNQKCIQFLGSQLVLSKTGHTSEGSIIHVSTIFSTKALLIFIVEFINWFLFVLPEAYKYYNRF